MEQWEQPARDAARIFCLTKLGDYRGRDQDDMLQIALLAAWRAHKDFDGRGSYGGYIRRKAQWAMLDALRGNSCYGNRASRGQVARGEWVTELSIDERHEGPDELDEVEQRDLISYALKHLNPREGMIIRRVIFEGDTDAAIARELGVSSVRVGEIRMRALQKLRRVVQSTPGEATNARP